MSRKASSYAVKRARNDMMYGPGCCGHLRSTDWIGAHKAKVYRLREEANDPTLAVPPIREGKDETLQHIPESDVRELIDRYSVKENSDAASVC